MAAQPPEHRRVEPITSHRHDQRSWPPPVHLVEEAREGDRGAITTLFAHGYPRLIGFFRVSGARGSDAEDLAADAVESMVRHLGRLRSAESFEAWFWTIARTHLRTWIRKKSRPRRLEPATIAPAPPDEKVETREEHVQVVVALEALSDRDRQLLWLREVEGLSYDEIGGRLRAAAGTVRVACHRARKRLEDAYRALEEAPGTAVIDE